MKQERGFTLVELLVVIAILTVLPIIVVSDFPRIRLQFALSRAAHTFAQDVRNAQDLALSSLTYTDQFGVTQPNSGYGIYVDVNGLGATTYVIYADKTPANNQYDAQDYIVKTVDFSQDEPGIIITGVAHVANNQASINFKPPNPDITITQLDQGENSVEVTFALASDPSTYQTVSINTSGLIEVK